MTTTTRTGAWTDGCDRVAHWTWINAIEHELARRKKRELREMVDLAVKMAEADARLMLTRKAKQVAEYGRHRAKLVHMLKERAWDLACHRMAPGHA
jgi:hypothetical protein